MVVLYYGHTPVLKYLLRSGFDVDATDKNGRTTLIYSTSRYFIDDAKLLIERKTFFKWTIIIPIRLQIVMKFK